MSGANLIGYLAAILGTVCWLPQVLKTVRSRQVDDLSLTTNLLLLLTLSLWFMYGLLSMQWPIILANLFSICCVGTIVLAKLIWGRS